MVHGINDWVAIAALVSGRTISQCICRWNIWNRWCSDMWTESEDEKLKHVVKRSRMLQEAVQLQGGTDWVVVAARVPGRMKSIARKDGIPSAAASTKRRDVRFIGKKQQAAADRLKMETGSCRKMYKWTVARVCA
jgi:hypothetical protein